MSWLAMAMDARGGDSFGIAKRTDSGRIKRWRQVGRATGQLKLANLVTTQQIMLHTRKKTHGAVCIENAHPVLQHHILGCHNGIVHNHSDLNESYGREFELDSRHIFEHIATKKNVAEIDVYGAIAYIDINTPNQLNLCRLSTHGDLEVVGIGTNKDDALGVVYASTFTPIEAALKSLGLPYFKYNVPEKVRHYIKDGQLWIGEDMPFGEHVLHTARSYSGYRGAQDKFEVPKGLKFCKPCKKELKKRGYRGIIPYQVLCTPCWDAYRHVRGWFTRIGTTSAEAAETDKKKDESTTRTTNTMTPSDEKSYDRSGVAGGAVCSSCGEASAITRDRIPFCCDCYEAAFGVPVEANEKFPYSPACQKAHHIVAIFRRKSSCLSCAQAAKKREKDNYSLSPFDPCAMCCGFIKAKIAKEAAKYQIGDETAVYRFSPDGDLCPRCRADWKDLIDDFRALTSFEKRQWSLVVYCNKCGIPIFGRPRAESEEERDKGHPCFSCENRCRKCGKAVVQKKWRAGMEGTVELPCDECVAASYARVGSEVPLPVMTRKEVH